MPQTTRLGYESETVRRTGTVAALAAGFSLVFIHPRLAALGPTIQWASLAIHGIVMAFVAYSLVLDVQHWRRDG